MGLVVLRVRSGSGFFGASVRLRRPEGPRLFFPLHGDAEAPSWCLAALDGPAPFP